MRVLSIILTILISLPIALAGNEAIVELDRIALLVPGQEDIDTHSSRIAVHFTLPEEIENNQIIYAEIVIPLDFSNVEIESNSTLELQAYNITSNWSEEDTWNSLAEDIDTLSFYTYTITMSRVAHIFMDVTKFVRPIVENNASNFGLMLVPLKHDTPVFHVNQAIVNQISQSALLRIVYK